MTKLFKPFSLILACVLVFGSAKTAFATEDSATLVSEDSNSANSEVVTLDETSITPFRNGDKVTFKLGNTGYIQNCGNRPKFRFRASGGSSNTLIKFHITTSGGTEYTQGNIKADGSQYIDKQYVVLNGKGTWSFSATIVSGTNNGKITCSVEQVY